MQLAHDHALSAVNHESPLRRHERQFAHEHLFFLRALLFLELKGHIEWRAVSDAFAQALQPILFGLADLVAHEIQPALAIVALDREDFLEHRLQADVLAPAWSSPHLQKLHVRVGLQLDQVRRGDDFLDFSKVDSISRSRWHF